jgi:hypothetical protein
VRRRLPAPNPAITTFCCFTPSPQPRLVRAGSDDHQPGSTRAPGRFRFACYGRTPGRLPPIVCTEGPIDGVGAEGYAAKLYCCDFVLST